MTPLHSSRTLTFPEFHISFPASRFVCSDAAYDDDTEDKLVK